MKGVHAFCRANVDLADQCPDAGLRSNPLAVNKLLGSDHRVAMTTRNGHTPTESANERIYRFFEWWLGEPK